MRRRPPRSPLFPYTTLFLSLDRHRRHYHLGEGETFLGQKTVRTNRRGNASFGFPTTLAAGQFVTRSEEHTSELQSRQYLVCRLLLEKKKKKQHTYIYAILSK